MFLLILFMIGTVFEIAYLPLHKREFPLMYSAHNTSERDSHTGGNAFAEFPCSCSDNYDLANIVLSAMILGLLFPLGVLATLRRFQKQHFELELRTEAHRRESEQMSLRNDELLRGLFPPAMAAQVLSLNGSTHNWCKSDMNLHQDVSVLQVDIKGFTALSTRIDAGELLDIVNAIFSSIDAAAEIIGGLFKIDTIGDCYKAVSGLLVPCKDHADKVADLALAIIDIVDIISRRLNIPDLSVRLGIGTGPVVAAAVGQLRPKFCIYGKACQEANLMVAPSPQRSPS